MPGSEEISPPQECCSASVGCRANRENLLAAFAVSGGPWLMSLSGLELYGRQSTSASRRGPGP